MAVGMTLVILTSWGSICPSVRWRSPGAVAAASIVGVEVNALEMRLRRAGAGRCDWRRHWRYRRESAAYRCPRRAARRDDGLPPTVAPVNTGFTDNADLFGWFGIGVRWAVPTPVWIMAIVFIAALHMLHHTRLGTLYSTRAGR